MPQQAAPMIEDLGDSSGESQPEEEPMDEQILNAKPEEWAPKDGGDDATAGVLQER